MSRYVSFRDFDWVLLVFVLLICGLGVSEIRNATAHTKFAGAHVKQMYWIAAGVGCMFLVSFINYNAVLDQIHWLYIASIASLMVVLIFGQKYLGARRWVKMPGGGHFQPSEWVKLILILAMAKYFADLNERELSWADFMKAGAIVAIPMLMVLRQPDLGTALVLMPMLAVGAFLAGLKWQHMAVFSLAGILLVGAVFYPPVSRHILKPYQRDRITSFLHPEEDAKGSGYQLLQSKIAVGSGGFWGKGFGNGSQNQLGYIPVRYSDFIMSAWAEEQGFKGVLLALGLYMALLLRLVQNAQRAKDRAGMFLVMGVAAALGFHVLVNVAMVIGAMPVTGIPLPLMSYGGSATLFVFLAIGLVMNVRLRRFVN